MCVCVCVCVCLCVCVFMFSSPRIPKKMVETGANSQVKIVSLGLNCSLGAVLNCSLGAVLKAVLKLYKAVLKLCNSS